MLITSITKITVQTNNTTAHQANPNLKINNA